MQRNAEYILSSVEKHEAMLRKNYQSILAKIEEERRLQEKFIQRRDFYEKLQTNVIQGQQEAHSKLEEAEKAMAVVQQKEKEVESKLQSSRAALTDVLDENKRDVEPELERLAKLLDASKQEVAISSREYANATQRLQELRTVKASMETEESELKQSIKEREEVLSDIKAKPEMDAEELAKVQQDSNSIKREIDCTLNDIKEVQTDISQNHKLKIAELGELKKTESKKLQQVQKKHEETRLRVDGSTNDLAEERVRQYSLASERVEIELQTKKAQSEIKHNTKFLAAENRQLNVAKNNLVKKQQKTAKVKSQIPLMQSKLKDLHQTKSILESEKKSYEHTLSSMKEKVEANLMKLYDEEYVEKDTFDRLDESTKAVSEKECEIEQARIEERRANAMLSLTKEKRAFTRRKIENAEQLKKDVDMEIQVREVQQLDLSKKIKHAEKKTKDFALLHDMIVSEKADCTRLIGETEKALSAMKLRHDKLQMEIRALNDERDEKMKTLHEEVDARIDAQQKRLVYKTMCVNYVCIIHVRCIF